MRMANAFTAVLPLSFSFLRHQHQITFVNTYAFERRNPGKALKRKKYVLNFIALFHHLGW